MSQLDKLQITGVRSFSPHESSVIEFFSPLTVIVGHNGAGKTSVIECLKYATTGLMPPGSKGASFVHDPKVVGEAEVKAKVKLRFRTTGDQVVTVSRSLQLTQKAKTSTLKTLDGSISVLDTANNTRVSQSKKCTDMDKEVPRALGVSRPILENVIFCHQEDSNWPLSEASVLKKRFDDIFSATRYIKALDAIKKYRIAKNQDKLEIDVNLANLNIHKKKAMQLRDELRSIHSKINESRDLISSNKAKLEPIEARLVEIAELRSKLVKLESSLETAKGKRKMLDKMTSDLKNRINVLLTDYTDEQVHSELSNANSIADASKNKEKDIEHQIRKMEDHAKLLSDQFNHACSEHGKFVAQEEAHRCVIRDRNVSIQNLAGIYDISGFSDINDMTEALVSQFWDVFSTRQQMLNDEMRMIKEKGAIDQRDVQDKLDHITGELQRIMQIKHLHATEIKSLSGKLTTVQRQLASFNGGTPQEVKAAVDRADASEIEVANKRSQMLADGTQNDISSLEQKIKVLDERLVFIVDEMSNCHAHAQLENNIRHSEEELRHHQGIITDKMDEHKQQLTTVFGYFPTNFKELPMRLHEVHDRKAQSVEQVRKALEDANGKLVGLNHEEQMLQVSVDRATKTLDDNEKQIYGIIGNDTLFSDAREAAETRVSKAQRNAAKARAIPILYRSFIKTLTTEHRCSLCSTSFAEGTDGRAEAEVMADMKAVLEQQMTDNQADVHRQELEAAEHKLAEIKNVAAVAAEADRLRTVELPQSVNRLSEVKKQCAIAHSKKMECQDSVDIATSQLSDIDCLHTMAINIANSAKLVDELTSKLVSLKQQRTAVGNFRDLSTIKDDRDTVQTEKSEAVRKVDRLRIEMQQHQNELNVLETKARTARNSAVLEENKQVSRTQLVEESRSLESERDKLQGDQVELGRQMEPLRIAKTQALEDREKLLAEVSAVVENKEKDIMLIRRNADRLKSYQTQISEYVDKGGPSQRADSERVIAEREMAIKEQNEKLKSKRTELVNLQEANASTTEMVENLKNNCDYRMQVLKLKALNTEIDDIKHELCSIDRSKVVMEEASLVTEQKALQEESQRQRGSQQVMKEQERNLDNELKTPLYKNINEKHRDHAIKKSMLDFVTNDLSRYHKALDAAIMRYHHFKMEEINSRLKELWQETYRGNDIDFIAIRSQAEQDPSSDDSRVPVSRGKKKVAVAAPPLSTSSARQTYNYRVVMVKGDVELDMRSRCSAGQKALTSLLVRLALSETFGAQCGVLALDEPTTNLDHDNVVSFAEALQRVVQSRRDGNFQLIVITHDEEFVQKLAHDTGLQCWYKVAKNENACSTILRQAFIDNDQEVDELLE